MRCHCTEYCTCCYYGVKRETTYLGRFYVPSVHGGPFLIQLPFGERGAVVAKS